jgi:tetratricopeptide (TPR) repeat protein
VSDLVGRQPELVAFDSAIDAAAEGRGAFLLLRGEPGIGKSALARALADRAAAKGFLVCWGRAWEAGGAPPYWLWIEVLREVVAHTPTDALTHPSHFAAIADLVPELRGRGPAEASIPGLDREEARFLRFDAIARVLRLTSGERAIAIVLDDLHAADLASLDLLRFVSPSLRAARVVILGTHRTAEARMSRDIAETLARLGRDASCFSIARLADADSRALLERVGLSGSPAFERIVRKCEGNPLFLHESARLLRTRGFQDGPLPLADSVRDVIRTRLSLAPPDARALLEIAAVDGRQIDLALVCLAAGTTLEAGRQALRGAISSELVGDLGGERWAFTHVLLRDVLYEDLSDDRRAELHVAFGEALERRSGIEERTRIVGLATHFLEGAARGGVERAAAHVLAAADRAVELQAHEEAAALLDRALAVFEVAHPGGAQAIDLLLALGRTCLRAGEFKRGQDACHRAAHLARVAGDRERVALAALTLGEVFTFATIMPELVALLREALDAVGPTPSPLRARLLARLAAATQPALDPATPMAMAREAIAMVRRFGDSATRLSVLFSAGSALAYFADPAERIALGEETAEIAHVLGDKVRLARCRLRLVADYFDAGDVAASDAQIAEYERIASEIGLISYTWWTPLLRAMRAVFAGRFEEATRLYELARSTPGRPTGLLEARSLLTFRAGWSCASTKTDELPALAEELGALLHRTADPWYAEPCLAVLAARSGRHAEAKRILEDAKTHLDDWRPRVSAAWIAEASALAGDREAAAALREVLMPFARRNHSWGTSMMVSEGPIVEALGLCCATLEHWDEAIAHFEDALLRLDAMGGRPHAARVRLLLARALRSRGNPRDEARATELLAAAEATARELDMPGLLAKLTRESETPKDTVVPVSPASAQPDARGGERRFEMVREGEFWTLRYAGATKRFKDSRGMQLLDELVRRAGEEIHVLDLMGAGAEADRGDAGEVLDRTAITRYRARAEELREELEDAEARNDLGRVDRLREELDAIADELTRGMGLGGRSRRAGQAAERARVNVRRRLVITLEHIAREMPALAKHLERSLKTGVFCSYEP